MMIRFTAKQRGNRGGFTLVELLLTVGIILLLAGAVIFNLGTVDHNARLDESATLVESLLRYARAQASSRGREVIVVFGDAPTASTAAPPKPETTTEVSSVNNTSAAPSSPSSSTNAAVAANPGVQVLWEPDPIGAPGKFEPLPGADTLTEQLNELVKVHEVRPPGTGLEAQSNGTATAEAPLTEAAVAAMTPASSGAVSAPIRPVKFFPDGSSDSVEIVLGNASDEDTHRLLVSLSGTTGTLRHRFFNLGPDGLPVPETAGALPGTEGNPTAQP